MTRYQLTRISGNSKTGPIATTMSSSDTCPDSCALKGQGCYARFGMVGMHWRKLDAGTTGTDLAGFIAALETLPRGSAMRHNVAGDLESPEALASITQAAQSRKLRAWTYTHHKAADMLDEARRSNQGGSFTVNLSADSPAQADALASLDAGPVVTVMRPDAWQGQHQNTSSTPAGRTIVRCPAEYMDSMTCAQCMLCQKADRRGIVGFTAHGTGKNKVISIIPKHASKGSA